MRPFVSPQPSLSPVRVAQLAALGIMASLATPVRAQHNVDQVVTAFEPDNAFDIHASVNYEFGYYAAAIRRDWVQEGRRVLARDLLHRHLRHSLTPRLEIGLFRGLAVYAELPVILQDQRDYRFDRSSPNGCINPNQASTDRPATCVDKTNSSTLRDGIVPTSGFSANRQGGPFMAYPKANADVIFRGPNRHGIDQLHLGIKYAILRQSKQPAFPTWLLAFESRLGIGAEQTMQRHLNNPPASNARVGRRIHEFGFWTSIHRYYRFIQPYASAYARWSVAAKSSALGRINFPGTPTRGPQNKMGLHMGAIVVP